MTLVVFDLGGSAVKYGLWSDGALNETSSFKTPITWNEMKQHLNSVFQSFKSSHVIEGVAISAPGSIQPNSRVIEGNSAIPYIHDVAFVDELESLFECRVTIENDARCVALAEMWKGTASHVKSAVIIAIGSGIGGAVIVDGRIQNGRNAFGGEFGCMVLDGTNSFSELGTAVTMAHRYASRMGFEKHHFSGRDIFLKAKEGDPVAIDEVETFYHFLALGIWNLQFVTDPSLIVLGGGVTQNADLLQEIQSRIEKRKVETGLEEVTIEIQLSQFLNDANLVGAVYAHHNKPEDYLIVE